MKELNELVDLAKKATNGEWCAFISTGGDGTFSIHTQDDNRKGDIVNWPGFDTANCSKAQKKANAKYIAAANPETILAIAEAFLALEQRAEAAEAKAKNLNDGWLNAIAERDEARAKLAGKEKELAQYVECFEAESARADRGRQKLAELEKQEPYGYVAESPCSSGYGGMMHEFSIDRRDAEHDANQAEGFVIELFTRPAPAVSLAELVPQRKPITLDAPISAEWAARTSGYRSGFNDCVDEILRNIEEGNK